MPLEFKRSEPLTFGVELELMVLNTHDYDLTRGASDLLRRLEKVKHPGEVKPEITESMIEVNSSVHTRYDALLTELRQTRDAIVTAAGKLNLAIAGGGAHPFHKWSDRRIFDTERFQRVSQLYGYLAKQFTVFGQHIHIGVQNGDDAVYLTHRTGALHPALHRALGGLALLPGRGHVVRDLAPARGVGVPARRPPARGGVVEGIQRLLRRDGGPRHRHEHEGLLLGHPPEARVRHDGDPHLRHAAHRRDGRAARRLRADARRGPPAQSPLRADRTAVPRLRLQPLPGLALRLRGDARRSRRGAGRAREAARRPRWPRSTGWGPPRRPSTPAPRSKRFAAVRCGRGTTRAGCARSSRRRSPSPTWCGCSRRGGASSTPSNPQRNP